MERDLLMPPPLMTALALLVLLLLLAIGGRLVLLHTVPDRWGRRTAPPVLSADAPRPAPAPSEDGLEPAVQSVPPAPDGRVHLPAGAGSSRLSSGLAANEAALRALVDACGAEFRTAVAAADAALQAAQAARDRYDAARGALEDVGRAVRALEGAPDASRSP